MLIDPIVHVDKPNCRKLDLRPFGIDCIPVLGWMKLNSIGSAPDQHIHRGCIEIVLCLRGILTFLAGDKRYEFLPGGVFVSTDRQPHALAENPKGLATYSLLYSVPKLGKSVLGLSARETGWLTKSLANLPHRRFRDATQIKEKFARLFRLYDAPAKKTLGARLEMKSAVLDLLLAVISSAHAENIAAPACIAAIADRIVTHPENDYSLRSLADEAGLATVSFSALFKRATGLPPHGFILYQRIRRACELLTDTSRSIRAISDTLRFASPQHFTSAFRAAIGQTPARYRATKHGPRLADHGTNR